MSFIINSHYLYLFMDQCSHFVYSIVSYFQEAYLQKEKNSTGKYIYVCTAKPSIVSIRADYPTYNSATTTHKPIIPHIFYILNCKNDTNRCDSSIYPPY